MYNDTSMDSCHNRSSPEQALSAFLTFKKSNGLAPRTVNDYRKMVGRFFRDHREAWGSPLTMRIDVMAWLSQDIAPATYNLRFVYLRAFWRWAVVEGLQPETPEPFRGLKRRKDAGKFKTVSLDDVKALIDAVPRGTYACERDLCAMVLTLDVAIRPGEMLALVPGNLDLSDLVVVIPAHIAKTRESRTLPLSPGTVGLLRDFLRHRPTSWEPTVSVFASERGRQIGPSHWGHRVKEHAQRAGVNLTPYDLRHAACTLHLRAGMNTLVLQKLMGHTGPQMTMRYTHLDIDDLRDQQRASSPVDALIPPTRERAKRSIPKDKR